MQRIGERLREPETQARFKDFKQNLALTFTDLNLSYLIRIQEATVELLNPETEVKHQVAVVTDSATFLGILNRSVDGLSAFTSGKLKVHGSIPDLLKLQGLLRAFG